MAAVIIADSDQEGTPGRLPRLPAASNQADADWLAGLRHFHLGDPNARPQPLGADWLPALLGPYRESVGLRYDYPLFLNPPDAPEGVLVEALCARLRRSLESFAPEAEQARVLKDNLPRLERWLRQLCEGTTQPVAATDLLARAGQAMQQELQLSDPQRDRLQADLDRLLAGLPAQGRCLAYTRYAALHLLLQAVRQRLLPRHRALLEEIRSLVQGLKTLLEVEWRKSDASRQPQALAESVGSAGSRYLDAAALAALLGQARGSRPLSAARRERIEAALPLLQAFLDHPLPDLVVLVHAEAAGDPELQAVPGCIIAAAGDPCARAMRLFDAQAQDYADLLRAVRIARLELADGYVPPQHDPWFATFNWQAFSREELLLIPPVIVLESAAEALGERLRSLSQLLSSARPVQILLEVQPGLNPGTPSGEDPLACYRVEPGYLGIAHRRVVVQQSSAARPAHFLEGLLAALEATCTGLHLVDAVGSRAAVLPWLAAGAALESRAHPLFRVNPEAGPSWAARMTLKDNPQPQADWPVYVCAYYDETGAEYTLELAFTLADYALLEPALQNHFSAVADGLETDALVPLTACLAREPSGEVPFIWAVDGQGVLHRVVISRALLLACRDRRDFWHTLQELAGVNNRHVELAVARTRAGLEAAAAQERERLQAEQRAAVERVRREAAGEAMQRLTQVLLGMEDLTQVARPLPAAKPVPPVETPAAVEVEAKPPPAPQADPEAASAGEGPWIDSVLCTSCNDCITINPRLFVYNENRQATIGDPQAGSYAQLVQAAEACPARCIHPGQPLDPAEPDLKVLVERAAPFA